MATKLTNDPEPSEGSGVLGRSGSVGLVAGLSCLTPGALAEVATRAEDRPLVQATSETTLRWFRRALLPGPNGSVVRSDTAVPAFEYLSLSGHGLDGLGEPAGLDFEFWGWAALDLVENEAGPGFDGDIGSANATQRFDRAWVRVGRQLVAGGAARYSRFDGVAVGSDLGYPAAHHGRMEAYAGFTVLPRWDARPGYHHLGSAQDSLLTDPDTLEAIDRAEFTVAGVRASWGYERIVNAGASFHEQERDGEIDRRNAGVSLRVLPNERLAASSDVVFELDSLELADARSWIDWRAHQRIDLSVEYLHLKPDLFLSRQSVLGVFSTEAFDELGATLSYRPTRRIELAPYGYMQWFPEDELGARGGVRSRVDLDPANTSLMLDYGRVVMIDGGYHLVRGGISYRLDLPVTLFAETHHYAYDRAIEGHRGSSVYAASCLWDVTHAVNLLWGTSLASTPYAEADLQTLLRLRVSEVLSRGGGRP